jgi:hypothetical protein
MKGMKGKKHSAEARARIAESLRTRMSDPAVRAEISVATKARMADPAVRQRIRDGMAAAAGDLVSLTVLRSAWQGAPPNVRRRFFEELLAPVFEDAAEPLVLGDGAVQDLPNFLKHEDVTPIGEPLDRLP